MIEVTATITIKVGDTVLNLTPTQAAELQIAIAAALTPAPRQTTLPHVPTPNILTATCGSSKGLADAMLPLIWHNQPSPSPVTGSWRCQ